VYFENWYSHFEKGCCLGAGLFFIFLEADTALYIGYISSNSSFTEENKGLEAHTGLYQP
jgi:hypothetical protein